VALGGIDGVLAVVMLNDDVGKESLFGRAVITLTSCSGTFGAVRLWLSSDLLNYSTYDERSLLLKLSCLSVKLSLGRYDYDKLFFFEVIWRRGA
jgi:hypothetical protein